MVSVDEVSSPEKNDTKISNFDSVSLFSRAQIVRQCQGSNVPFQLKLGLNECHFGLP